jgi:hypothetical protein
MAEARGQIAQPFLKQGAQLATIARCVEFAKLLHRELIA